METTTERVLKGPPIEKTYLFFNQGKLRLSEEAPHEVSSLLSQERLIAYQKGKEEGEREGYLKAFKEVEALEKLLRTLSQRILEEREALLRAMKPEALEFCLEICKKYLRSNLKDPDILLQWIEGLLSLATESLEGDEIIFYLSSEDYKLIEHSRSRLAKGLEKKKWKVIIDPLLHQGDVRLEATSGLVHCIMDREFGDLREKIRFKEE